jgi:putative transposase
MTETIRGVSAMPKDAKKRTSSSTASARERAAIAELVKAARDRGEDITGPDGLLKSITATVLEAALEEEMTDHLGHPKHQAPEGGAGNIRNGTRGKTVLTDAAGEVTIEVPRDRAGTFEPVIVKKRQRRLSDVDAVAISLFAKGLTTGEISAHFAEVYGASISKDTISRITDRVVEEMQGWCSRPLQGVYAAIFIDAIYVKVRDGQVGNQPFYAAIGVDLGGRRDVLGLWAGKGGGESAKFWMNVLADLKNRGVADVFFVVCDGLKGLPDSVNAVFPQAIVQACVIHLIRATLRYASRKYWDQLAKDLRAIYTAPTVEAAWAAFEELEEKWGKPYPAIPKLWRAAWEEFTPFLAYGACREMGCGADTGEGREHGSGNQRASRLQTGFRCARSGSCRAVDLQQVEGGGGEVDLAERVVQAAA